MALFVAPFASDNAVTVANDVPVTLAELNVQQCAAS